MDRIISLDNLEKVLKKIRSEKKSVVFVGGCFDILHRGHIKFLKESKRFGDILIIALEHDENVRRLKGNTRPFQKQLERAEILSSLRFVDYVLALPPMNKYSEYESLVETIRPDAVSMTEGDIHIAEKKEQGEKVGAVAHIIPKTQTLSTSELAKKVGLE
ncbi:adenylyltransferase/cytidyltransferase family protein [Candidatus Gottesmanbacteria bacterium]|nr:adenylyltransferase/cytidyltransferase family protein [Candidatus Gottesmanbacteria bacterium]